MLTKAEEARVANERAGARDKLAIEVLASYDNDGKLNADTLIANIQKHAVEGWSAEKGSEEGGFPVTVIVDGYTFEVQADGTITDIEVGKEPNPPEGDTRPLVNTLTSLQNGKVRARDREGKTVVVPAKYKFAGSPTDKVSTGIVIQDGSKNEYVWIEVPKEIYDTDSEYNEKNKEITSGDTTDIEKVLRAYSNSYADNTGNQDQWYAWENSKIVTHDKASSTQKGLNTGCGLNYDDYYALKKEMLKSIYENEGFWIGRYEAGIESHRALSGDATATALRQPNKYPYNYITCSQAQSLASNMKANGSDVTSSLMFGVQWNLVCRFIKENVTELGGYTNGDVNKALRTDSSKWGNYDGGGSYPVEFEINRGKYTTEPGRSDQTWKEYTTPETGKVENIDGKYMKKNGQSVLLTTGASETNKVLNIYDFAGNEWEWTLEKATSPTNPCCDRGGCCSSQYAATYASVNNPTRSFYTESFRVTLY